jgi:hypothetical protein
LTLSSILCEEKSMSTNLVSLVMQFVTPEMIGRIASALGLNRNSAQTAIAAAVPALLSGLLGATTRPGGTQSLVDAIKQQSGVLDGFAKMIGGEGQSSVIDKGTSLLSRRDCQVFRCGPKHERFIARHADSGHHGRDRQADRRTQPKRQHSDQPVR